MDISLAEPSSKPVQKEPSSSPDKKLGSSDDDGIPDSVLQYERQLRKVQAEQRASTKLGPAQLEIIYEDYNVLIADKPPGVLCVVPGLHNKPSLLQLVCQHCNIPMEHASKMIVHRLDMNTSGVVSLCQE